MEKEKKGIDKENLLFSIVAVIIIIYALFNGTKGKLNKETLLDETETVVTSLVIEKVEEDTCSIEPITYSDEKYVYTFNCELSHISVNNKIYSIVKALDDKVVTIKDLESNGFLFNRTIKEGE